MNECKPLDGGQHDVGRGLLEPGASRQGSPVQVDPIKPKLKPPRTKRLKLKCDVLLSKSAFKSNLRRYAKALMCLDINTLGADFDDALQFVKGLCDDH